MSFLSWLSFSEAIPSTQIQMHHRSISDHQYLITNICWTLTEFLQTVQVNDVLCGAIVPGADEQVGLLQDEIGLLPLLRVQHGPVPHQPDTLKLPGEKAVTAERGCRLRRSKGIELDRGHQRGLTLYELMRTFPMALVQLCSASAVSKPNW